MLRNLAGCDLANVKYIIDDMESIIKQTSACLLLSAKLPIYMLSDYEPYITATDAREEEDCLKEKNIVYSLAPILHHSPTLQYPLAI